MTDNKQLPDKPIPLRIIFILNALMCILPFVFYLVITSKDITIGGLDPKWMLFTGAAYIISFVILVRFILTQNYQGVRGIIILNILIALPAKAYIGIAVAIISFALTFNNKLKAFFHNKK